MVVPNHNLVFLLLVNEDDDISLVHHFNGQDDDHHILSKLDIHNELISVECDLCPILFFMVVPNHNLVFLLLVNEDDDISLVHHFNERNLLAQILNLFLQTGAARVVLQNFKTSLSCDSEILLGLI